MTFGGKKKSNKHGTKSKCGKKSKKKGGWGAANSVLQLGGKKPKKKSKKSKKKSKKSKKWLFN